MKKPNWQIGFRNLPIIPNSKRWIVGENQTLEQKIANKLIANEQISIPEIETMQSLVHFYRTLFISLQNLTFHNFSSKDLINFKNYIFYVFNYSFRTS